jgi:hypothetical protein
MNKYQVQVEIECPFCDQKFITYQWICDGTTTEWCCGPDCYNEYHSTEKKRERILNKLLNE